MDLTDEVKRLARRLGADVVGVAPVDRFRGAPRRMSPEGLLPGARCVVVAGIHHLDAAVELAGVPTPHDTGPYDTQCTAQNPALDDISFSIGRLLEDRGHRAVTVSASNIWRYRPYKDLDVSFGPDLAHRYAAVAAGLGQIGWSGLVLTPQFGPRCRFVSVVTDAELAGSPMYAGEDLCDKCMQCVETCPVDAFRKEVARINEIEIGGKVFRFPATSKWRCAWAENFCLDLAHDIPDRVDEATILRYLARYGQRGGELGCCLQFCMNPQQRLHDAAYCRPPRRAKTPAPTSGGKLLEAVRRIAVEHGAEVLAVTGKDELAGGAFARAELHLPDARSVICLGVRVPPACAGDEAFERIAVRRLDYAAFWAAHHLDLAGHAAICRTRIRDDLVARALGVGAAEVRFETVLTSAVLPAARPPRPPAPELADAEALRALCRQAGADLVGFFSAERYAAFRQALHRAGLGDRPREVVEDAGMSHGPYLPRRRPVPAGVRRLDERLAGARSVIVLGVHFPHTPLDLAKVTPAETVGPYTFVRYEAQRLAGDAAFRVVQALHHAGRRAVLSWDLTGLASEVSSCRGMLPDMRANGHAALLAGLAVIGLNGCPITPEHGVRQVFIAIVTDWALPDDGLPEAPAPCQACPKPCLSACPTAALGGETVSLELEGRTFDLPRIDAFACDWAQRYGLAGEEGPKYCGLETDVPLPAERTAEALAEALRSVHWGVQKRFCNIAEECLRACPAGRPAPPPAEGRTEP